ncbi:hypothetical protein K5X82_15410 [Halosquirtibacter xylanolyticus]|uniref:hypothetical protein n=1 Tax=Halosquirtibacter xylanolyticus TaxID=3374599 RepID=UPI003748B978|nr:hypothetical protein K5X82_15410 [Prolixibacteraceae bacterium]
MVNQNDDTRLHGAVFSLVTHLIIVLILCFVTLDGQNGGSDQEYVVLVDNRGMDRVAQAKPKRPVKQQKNDKIATASKARPKEHQKKVEKIHKSVVTPKAGKSYKNKSNEGVKKDTPKVNNKKTTDINSVKKAEEKKRQEEERRHKEEVKREKMIKKRREDSIRKVQEKIKIAEQQAQEMLKNIITTAEKTKEQEKVNNRATASSKTSAVSTNSSKRKGLSVANRVYLSGAKQPGHIGAESGTIYLNLTVNPIGQVSKVLVDEGKTTITSQRTIDSAIAFVKTLKFNSVGNDQYDHGYYKLTYKNGGFY